MFNPIEKIVFNSFVILILVGIVVGTVDFWNSILF
jgi:hypothetical protein